MTRYLLGLVVVLLASPLFAQFSHLPTDARGRRAGGAAAPSSLGINSGGSHGEPAQNGAAQVGEWRLMGPFGGDVQDVAVSTVNSQLVLAALAPAIASGTTYRSTDGGDHWARIAALAGRSAYDIEFAPDGAAYVGTIDGIWKSTDGGQTWTALDLNIGPNRQVLDIALDPHNPLTIWAGVADAAGAQPINVVRSTDGGVTWSNKTPPLAAPLSCYGIAISAANANVVAACFGGFNDGGQVWVSTNGGSTWSNRSAGLPDHPMRDIVLRDNTLWVCGGQLFQSEFVGLYASSNLGLTWTAKHDAAWPSRVINDLEFDPEDGNVIYVASAGAGAFRSDDAGATWHFSVGGTAGLHLNSVRFAPVDSSRLFLGANAMAVLRSTNAGAQFAVSASGIDALDVVSIAANPNHADEMAIAFQGLNNGGVYTSTDAGQNWLLEPLPGTRYNSVAFAANGTLFAVSGGPTNMAQEGLYRRNADASWTYLGPNQGPLFEADLAPIAFGAVQPGLLLTGGADFGVAGFEGTIWRSADAGANWIKTYEAIDLAHVAALAFIHDGTDSIALAALTDCGAQPHVGGALRSTDSGLSWAPASDGLPPGTQGAALCAATNEPSTLYLAASNICAGGAGGLFATHDAGQHWSSVTAPSLGAVLDVVCDPADDDILYILQPNPDLVLRSTDRGASFAPFNAGLASAGAVRDLALGAVGTRRLLLATSTGAYTVGLPTAVSVVAANPPRINPFTSDQQPFRDVLQTGTTTDLTQGIGGGETPPVGSVVYGTLSVTFDAAPAPAPSTTSIAVSCTDISANGSADCPAVTQVAGSGAGPYVLTLSGPIPPRECTTITLPGTGAGQALQYQSLPGDVDMNGIVDQRDLHALIAARSDGSADQPANLPRYNINRQDGVTGQDIARLVQLLNGVHTTQPFTGATVAPCP